MTVAAIMAATVLMRNPLRRRHGRVMGIAARRERVRRRIRNYVDARHRQAGLGRQPRGDAREHVIGPDLGRVIHPQDEAVGKPVAPDVHHDRDDECADQAAFTKRTADEEHEGREKTQEQRCFHCARHGRITASETETTRAPGALRLSYVGTPSAAVKFPCLAGLAAALY
jgi:hypothetical protein